MTGRGAVRRRAHGRALLWLVLANVALMLADATGYLSAAGPAGALGWAFVAVAMVAQIATANLLVVLPLLVVSQLGRGYVLAGLLAPLVLTCLQLLVYIDRKIFALFRFHLNGLVVNTLTTPGGWDSMHVRQAELALWIALALALLAVEYAAYAGLVRRFLSAEPVRSSRRGWLVLVAAVAALGVAERVTYALSDIADAEDVTRSARLVPLYQPFTVRHLLRRYTRIRLDDRPAVAHVSGTRALRYPRAPLRFAAPARRPNIVWIVLDSWRADTFTPENTPEMWRLGLRSQVFLHHVSGGNSTRNGIFTMFYGLHGSYWQSVLAERSGPVLFARLKELGYRLRILSSSSLTFPEFRRTVFVDLAPDIRDAFSGASADVKDRQLVEALDAFSAEAGPDQPFFAFLFLDSPHAPYHFTPEFTPFRPFAKTVSYRAVDDRQGRALICNRYRDAVFYADHLVGEAVKRLEQHGLLERTIVLVTGDHGEECYEHGYWGHNGAFTPEQIRVPLVLYVPWLAPARHARLTGHQDLPATFLEMLGVENPPADYGSGRSLLRDEADPYEVSCGWDECALVDASGELVFGTQAYKAAGIDVLDPDYRAVADRKEALAARAQEIVALMSEMSAFLR